MNRIHVSLLVLILVFCVKELPGQVFVNFQNVGTFSAPEVSRLGLTASANTGVNLSENSGIGVLGGVSDFLIEVGETLDVQLPFAVSDIRMDSPPIVVNFNFELEAFNNGVSLGTVPFNFGFDETIDFIGEFGQPADAFSMTGIGGPLGGENLAYLAFPTPPLNNAGFEDGSPGQNGAPGWEAINSAVTVEGIAQTGSISIQLTAPTGQDFASSELRQTFQGVAEGMFVQASAFALHSASDPISGENFGRVILDFLDQDGNVIDANPSMDELGFSSAPINAMSQTDEFAFLNTGYVEAPAGTASARISLVHTQSPQPDNLGTGAVFFDDASLNITSERIIRTFAAVGEEFEQSDTQTLDNAPVILYELIHDGVSQVRIDTLGSDIDTEIFLYNELGRVIDSASGSPPDGTAGIQQAQLFNSSLPPGRYIVMVGRNLNDFAGDFFFTPDFQLPVTGNIVVTVSSNDLAPTTPPETVGTFNPVGFDFLDTEVIELDINDPSYFEVVYDGVAPITFTATEVPGDGGPSTSLGIYDVFGNLLETELDEISFDSLAAGTYYFGVAHSGIDFFPDFVTGTITSFTDPVTVQVSTGLLGDVNCDGAVNLLDVLPFVEILASGEFVAKADINQDSMVNLTDVGPFVDLLNGG